MSAGSISADPKPLDNPPLHRHYIVQPDGTRVEVGPNLCENPDLQAAFNQFHYNVHVGSLQGPPGGAPGLGNGNGAEIVGAAGCGV